MAFTDTDQRHMRRALELAARGLYTTHPNPHVGCVIVRDGAVVGEGWHERAGEPHAEVHALQTAGDEANGATVYVTLEPCSHFGRTPPCADALVKAGVAHVVVAAADPNPRVNGAGIARLRGAGIHVDVGLEEEAARALNVGFFSRFERGRPWVRVKLAMSLDGRTALANGESKWITSDASRADVQRWRARSSVILTGIGTVLADDPHLTPRLDEPVAQPLRVVLDSRLRTPVGAHVLDASAPTLLLRGAELEHGVAPAAAECDALPWHNGGLDLAAVMRELAARSCNEVQVEAGPTLCGALFAAGFVDELLLYIAPVLLGDSARPLLALPPISSMAQRWNLKLVEQQAFGPDIRLRLRTT